MINLLIVLVLTGYTKYTELNIKGLVEKPKTIYVLQRSKINKKLLKQRFSFKDALKRAIDDKILEEY